MSSFFDLPDNQTFLAGGSHEQENIEVYTWGEESYDGLGDALQEGDDNLNDETFGGTGHVGSFLLLLIFIRL
jgi:DNA topoisomerase 2-associated protein PAT1